MPAALRKLLAAAANFGVTYQKPNKGSHWKTYRPGYRMYPIPAHNAERSEIGDEYIRGMCRAFGIDEAELRKFL